MDFKFGLEHEVAFIREDGFFVDFTNTKSSELEEIVDSLPLNPNDAEQWRIGDLGIKTKRWYIEGFERFNEDKSFREIIPKGIEIRTRPHNSPYGAVNELKESFELLKVKTKEKGLFPVWISYNPFQKRFIPDPPLNHTEEIIYRETPEDATAELAMASYGPDLNISGDFTDEDLIDIGMKLNFYSPFIVPFSFSSPFYGGELWHGPSIRTFIRTGLRPATLVFLKDVNMIIASDPSITKPARIPAEVGRIEFKAFDAPKDLDMYISLFLLLKGLIIDRTLKGRALIPDKKIHEISGLYGFKDEMIYKGARETLNAAINILPPDERKHLKPLKESLDSRSHPAKKLIEDFKRLDNIIHKVLKINIY